ncbi:mandelate racemase/muconate lactonizing enzyme family protein [Acidobacterium sp. S8]|uniref:mandelate racemase/muconate lactonizing enzyme family protein n=1 Tax=Acidobacterium sp. S8 TaxID=1641854 RepID=UPI00131BC90F|nr:mandelate racemase/muconate lactonizing enzyme family protein [Acidobacterium sp. S8]
MQVVKIETIRNAAHPHVLWVQIHSDDGLVGLGETFYLPSAVEAVIHDAFAGFVFGRSAYDLESIWDQIFSYCNFFGYAGAEMRALSAIDIALWDLLGQKAGQPIFNLLGGKVRDDILIYNTCVDSEIYRDQEAFLERPAALAKDLLSRGITAMKIWPWDRFAPLLRSTTISGPAGQTAMGPSGSFLSSRNLESGLAIVKAIRDAVGNEMEILIEGHSRWDLNCAVRIARALEPYGILSMEDIMKPDSIRDLSRLVSETRVPQSVSERLFTRFAFKEVLEAKAAHIIMPDIVWTGGITEARKIAILADAFHLPIAPHDCTGLVTIFANMHLCAASTNAMILETVRGYYEGWYKLVYTNNVQIENGRALFPSVAGLGTGLKAEFLADARTSTRTTCLS